jgi:hypothetical protein
MNADDSDRLLVSAAAFLKRHRRESYGHAKRDLFLAWLRWYARDARLGIVMLEGRIVALALARCVASAAQAQVDSYAHDEGAPMVWVDDIVSTHPHGVPQLFRQVEQRFGIRQTLAGSVFSRAGQLRILPYQLVQRLTVGEPHHGLTLNSRSTCAA